MTRRGLGRSTEVGTAAMFIQRDPPPVDEWEYFKFSHHITFKLEPQEGLDSIVEPIMIVSAPFTHSRVLQC